ncbi:MAG: hypothetical protein ABIX28_16705, partial [Vicinamibacterales bacterium]
MAKKARAPRNSARRAGVRAPARVSTKRPASGRSRSDRTAAAFESTAAAAALDMLQVTLDLRDVSDRPIRDPETFFTFRRVSDRRQIGDQLAVELVGTAPVFRLPAAAGEVVVCEIDPKRFRFAQSPVFFRTPGPPIARRSQLLREPKE